MSAGPGLTPRRAIRVGDARARQRARERLTRRRRVRALLLLLRHWLGLRNSVVVEGVRYTERDPTPLSRAIGPEGSGEKEYFVRFPDGSGLRVRCRADRPYADLMPDPRLDAYRLALPSIKPGMRLLEIGAGTGAGSARLAWAVGPSGAVVALDRDGEAVRFARRRYPAPHLAVERGGVESLRGELDASFDAAVAHAPSVADRSARTELFRCVAPGGWVFVWDLPEREQPGETWPDAAGWDFETLEPGAIILRKPPARHGPAGGRSNLDQ